MGKDEVMICPRCRLDTELPHWEITDCLDDMTRDRDQWKRQAEASAASYRALSKRVEKSAHDQTVEVKL